MATGPGLDYVLAPRTRGLPESRWNKGARRENTVQYTELEKRSDTQHTTCAMPWRRPNLGVPLVCKPRAAPNDQFQQYR
jgi:hypothetical protein